MKLVLFEKVWTIFFSSFFCDESFQLGSNLFAIKSPPEFCCQESHICPDEIRSVYPKGRKKTPDLLFDILKHGAQVLSSLQQTTAFGVLVLELDFQFALFLPLEEEVISVVEPRVGEGIRSFEGQVVWVGRFL